MNPKENPTVEELKAMIERAEKATPGPWGYVDVGKRETRFCETITQVEPRTKKGILGQTILRHQAQWRMNRGNRTFITHTRTDLPHAAQYALELREALEEMWSCLNDFAGSDIDAEGNVVETRGGNLKEVVDKARALLQ